MIVTATLADALRELATFAHVLNDHPDMQLRGTTADKVRAALVEYDRLIAKRTAYEDTIESARKTYCNDEINIDDDAFVSVGDEGVWVEAWVWVQVENHDDED